MHRAAKKNIKLMYNGTRVRAGKNIKRLYNGTRARDAAGAEL
jgi:hypothetical protein